MANYQNLKAAISAAIRTNGNQEITGQVLQDVLNSIVSVIGANYTFAGVATPATNPGTPDQNVMYLAMEGGTYTNFNGTVLPAGISLLMWNGSWTSETVMYGDGGVFDISVYKSSGGTLATFADLSAALDGGNNIPASARKGGMSVKFVCTYDNNYVQYRFLLSGSFTDAQFTNVSNWRIEYEFRGSVEANTLFSDYTESGTYFFVNSILPTISDKPSSLVNGGMLYVTKGNFTNNGNFHNIVQQVIVTSFGDIYTRNIDNNVVANWNYANEVKYPTSMINNSNDADSITKAGAYFFNGGSRPSNLPQNETNGGFLIVNSYTLNNYTYTLQTVYFSNSHIYVRIWSPSATWVRVNPDEDPNILKYNGTISADTLISSYKKGGYYNILYADLANISDKPVGLNASGIVEVLTPVNTSFLIQRLTDTTGNCWVRYSPLSSGTAGSWILLTSNVSIAKSKWMAMGDSITEGYYSYFTNEEQDEGILAVDATKTWVSKTSIITGKTVTNVGIGGTGFVCKGVYNDKLNAKELVDTLSFTNVDLVTLAYGINDYKGGFALGSMSDVVGTDNTVVANMRYVIEKIQTAEPTAKVIVILPFNARGYSGSRLGDLSTNYSLGYAVNSKTLQDFYDAMVEVCEYYGIQYIDATHSSVISRYAMTKLLPDGVHPSEAAHTMIAREFSSKITCY